AALSEITGDRDYLTQGEAIAAAAIRGLAPGGILTEPCESGAVCDEDQAQFKGIFVRYLYDFWRHSRQPGYRGFILANANSVWDHARNPASQPTPPQPGGTQFGLPQPGATQPGATRPRATQFGLPWAGPVDPASPARQT